MKKIFKGRYYYKFEKHPFYYRGGPTPDILYKLIFDFKFIKLVKRVKMTGISDYGLKLYEDCFPFVLPILRGNLFVMDRQEFEDFNMETISGKGSPQYYCYNKRGVLCGSVTDLRSIMQNYLPVSDPIVKGVYYSRKLGTYFASTHRGGCTFKIGDKIFDELWKPKENDPILKKYESLDHIPFTLRGEIECKTLKDCRQSCINFINYVS